MFKAILVEKVNDFLDSDSYVSRIGTTAIGKTNSSFVEENVFVLSEKVNCCCFCCPFALLCFTLLYDLTLHVTAESLPFPSYVLKMK